MFIWLIFINLINYLYGLQVPEIRSNLLKCYDGKWKKIAKYQMKMFFNPSDAAIQEQARRLTKKKLLINYFL